MPIALTRAISPSLGRCELTHLAREPISLALAEAQHAAYERCLAELGCRVERLGAGPDLPDSVFIEDTAVVLDEVAVITRPGAESRRAETAEVARALAAHRPLLTIEPPGTLDGGDVLVCGRRLFVGCTGRTNRAGIEQLSNLLAPFGYHVESVPVRGCLHLKSVVTAVGDGLLLMNRHWVDADPFSGIERIEVDPREPSAANALSLSGQVIYPTAFPWTRERLERRGLLVRGVEAGELAKAEGGVTCCSLIFTA